MSVGSEVLQDEGLATARRLHAGGVTVRLEHYDGMPHVFPMVVPRNPAARRSWSDWANFSKQAVEEGTVPRPEGVAWIEAFTMREVTKTWEEMVGISDEEVDRKINDARRLRVERERELRKGPDGQVKAKL